MTIVICNHYFALGRFKAFNVWQLWGSVTNEKIICHHLHPIYSPFSFSLFISRFFSFFASCFSSFSLYFQPLVFASPAFIQVIFGVFRAFFGEPCVVLAFGNLGVAQAIIGFNCIKRTESIVSYGKKERSWNTVLTEENLKPSRLLQFSVFNEPGLQSQIFTKRKLNMA
ncbi:hypothetical protein ACOSP7_014194 [Xanthoceras sorbifolium]